MFSNGIKPLFLHLMATQSDTNTIYESVIEEYILHWLKSLPYYEEHSDLCGTSHLKEDPLNRKVVWSLVKGSGKQTIVMIHHHDAVDIEEYGKIKHLALRPDELIEALSKKSIDGISKKDLESGEWTFGRGSADMKAGAAIQMSMIEHFSQEENFNGNLLMLSVPDEETLSKGMLAAITLLTYLRSEHDLDYILTINSEPYFNQVKGKAIFYEGSVGKVMPVLYVKGVKGHVSDPFNGFNPSLVLADLQRKTELNIQLCDSTGNEATPPPVWVNEKDRKKAYDASIPEAASGYFNWLTFTRLPSTLLKEIKSIAKKSLRDTLVHFQDAYEAYCNLTGDDYEEIDLVRKVYTFSELFNLAEKEYGEIFIDEYSIYENQVLDLLDEGAIILPEATTRLIEYIVEYVSLSGPSVVIAISGPYYPHINNELISNGTRYNFEKRINEIAAKHYKLVFESKPYFMGISDLSYASWVGNQEDIETIKKNSPGWDCLYKIPFDDLSTLKMPVVNIGPWGKDLHKVTERVLTNDVYERTPRILSELIASILE